MKKKFEKKIWWNLLHLIFIVVGLLIWLIVLNNFCVVVGTTQEFPLPPQPPFLECLLSVVVTPLFWVYTIILEVVLYLMATLISWLYYKNKK